MSASQSPPIMSYAPASGFGAVVSRHALMAIVVLSLLAFAVRVYTDVHFKAWKSPNAMEHKTIATALAGGKGFTFGDWGYYGPTAVQSPPYPFLLAGAFKAFGAVTINAKGEAVLIPAKAEHAYLAMLILNALVCGVLVWATYLLVKTIGGSTTTAVLAAALVAFWPTQIYAARAVQAISLITLGLTGMTILYYRATRGGGAGAWTAYAFVATLVALVEPAFLPALLISAVMMLACKSLPGSAKVRNIFIFAAAIVAVIGPWTVRNFIVEGAFIPIKGSTWVNVWKGANDSASGSDRIAMTPLQRHRAWKQNGSYNSDDLPDSNHQYDMLTISEQQELANKPEPEREKTFRRLAMTWIETHPHRFIELCGIRLLKTLTVDWDNPRTYNLVYGASRVIVILLTLAGVIVAIAQRWTLGFPLMVFLTATAAYTLILTAARFAFPFEVFQLAMGAGLITAIAGKLFGKSAAAEDHRSYLTSATPIPAHAQ
jgi:hypothetical protein